MKNDTLILYKLIILYMLDRVEFPLTNSQISDFVLEKGYTNFFTLQQSINELLEDGFIYTTVIRNASHYQLNDNGREALSLLENHLTSAIKKDILIYFDKEKIELRNQAEVQADFYPDNGEFMVECFIKEKNDTLLNVQMRTPTKETAISICDHWREKSADIYQYLVTTLWIE